MLLAQRAGSRPVSAGAREPAGKANDVPYVYLLKCADDSLYCGWTTDLSRRLAAHQAGTASRYTRSRLPLEVAKVFAVADRPAALRLEARIKRLPRAAKLSLVRDTRQVRTPTAAHSQKSKGTLGVQYHAAHAPEA
jgi:putative endonuclease